MAQQVKSLTCNVGNTGDTDLIPGLGRSPEEENGNLFQYSCLKSPMDRGAWGYNPKGCKESDKT